jgi:sugar-specific transcriptional regulator TrmB
MHKNAQKLSEVLGLSLYEARLYLASLQQAQNTISDLARAASIPRTAVYPPLEALLKKGLMTSSNRGKRSYYSAVRPDGLRHLLDKRKIELESLIEDIHSSETISSPTNDLGIQYFYGQNGITMAGQIFLDETKQKIWYSFENPLYVVDLVGIPFEDEYVKLRVEKGIHSKMIVSMDVISPWVQDYIDKDKEQLRETLILSARKFPFESCIAITKGLIIMINAKDKPFAVLIRNDHLAKTLMSIHQMVWAHYKE